MAIDLKVKAKERYHILIAEQDPAFVEVLEHAVRSVIDKLKGNRYFKILVVGRNRELLNNIDLVFMDYHQIQLSGNLVYQNKTPCVLVLLLPYLTSIDFGQLKVNLDKYKQVFFHDYVLKENYS